MVGASGAVQTTNLNASEVDALCPASPEYCAVMVWVPNSNELVVRVATPFSRVYLPKTLASSMNCTFPLTPDVTVAVIVTGADTPTGLGVALRLTLEALGPGSVPPAAITCSRFARSSFWFERGS